MKNRYLLCLFLLLTLVGCNSSDSGNETITVTISSAPPLCSQPNEFTHITFCAPRLIDESGTQYGTASLIVNFEYKFGTEYTLLLEIVELTDPPADEVNVEYRILEVLREEQDTVGTVYTYESLNLISDAFVFVRDGVYSIPPHEFLCAADVDCDTLADMANSGGVVSIELTMTGGDVPVTVTNWE